MGSSILSILSGAGSIVGLNSRRRRRLGYPETS